MKDFVYLGKIVNTHGIKGEVRIISDFEKKNVVFKKDFKIYIGQDKKEEIINSYRVHKNYDMVTFKGIDDINEVLKYKSEKVYIKRIELNICEGDYLLEDILGFEIIFQDKCYGVVDDIIKAKQGNLLYIKYEKNYYIPYNDNFILSVDIKKKLVYTDNIEGLIL